MRLATSVTTGLVGVGLLLGGVACSDDESASVEVIDGGEASASGSASAPADAACTPANPELAGAATATVDIGLVDFAFEPSTLSVEPGVVTFRAANEGNQNHELAFLPGGGDIPLTDDGDPDEDALAEAGAFELEAFGPGQTCEGTWDLARGTYTLFCIVETPDGQTHAELGMVGSLTVG